MEQQTYSTVAWDLELSRGYWDRRPFFLAEGSTVQWAVQTESAEPAAFYVFGSAAAYADYAAHRRTAPLVAANGTHFAGNLTADNYGEYVFVVEARAHTALHWQLRFWRTRLSPAAARESCTVDHSICRLRTSKRVCPRSSHLLSLAFFAFNDLLLSAAPTHRNTFLLRHWVSPRLRPPSRSLSPSSRRCTASVSPPSSQHSPRSSPPSSSSSSSTRPPSSTLSVRDFSVLCLALVLVCVLTRT